MKIQLSFLKSKVAKRIFGLFLIASLLPISILAFFSFKQVDTLIVDKSMYQLRQEAKRYGLSLLERLILADEQLGFINSIHTANNNKLLHSPKILNQTFKSISSISSTNKVTLIHGDQSEPPAINENQKKHLLDGKPVLTLQRTSSGTVNLWLLKGKYQDAIRDQYSITAALLNTEFVWGLAENMDYHIGICIQNDHVNLLFCSLPSLADIIHQYQFQNQQFQNSTETSFSSDNPSDKQDGYFVSSWNLFLQSRFFISDFTIYSMSEKIQVTQSTRFLQDMFWSVIFLTFTVIIFFSVLLIRRNMVPLEDLMEGVKRIADHDFNHQVVVRGNDEFGQLANSFNHMSAQLGNSVDVLKAMAEIDRLILSNIRLEEIITTAITQLGNVIHCNTTSVVLLEANNKINIYYEYGHSSGKIVSIESTTSEQHVAHVFSKASLLINDTEGELPNYVAPLLSKGAHNFLLLPVSTQRKPAAILIFAYTDSVKPGPDQSMYAREFADRFGVALSNVRWKTKLYTQANYDTVTNLPNRNLVKNKLENAIQSARIKNKQFGVLFLDLDRFKHVNDSFGHSSGDMLLKLISERIRKCLPDSCIFGRLSGDEFIVITHEFNNKKQIDRLAANILTSLKHPFVLSNQNLHIATSIGIAIYPEHGDNQESLLKNADAAMYYAKSIGNGGFEYYKQEQNAGNSARLQIDSALHEALTNHEFELYYQPQINVKTGQIVGAEALIRWNHPVKGRVSPAEFIPIAEQNGLILAIGDWVLEKACKQNKQWQAQQLPKICMSINLTSKQFTQPNLVNQVKEVLHNNNLDVKYLDLEITETAAMVDVSKTLTTLNELYALGVNLSVDDYGTGYSSLSYLKDFPVQRLKIDQSFVRDMIKIPKNRAIVKSTITLGHLLNMKVIAEGVENPEELAFIKAEGCDIYQGYLFSRPVSAEQFAKLLANQNIYDMSYNQSVIAL